MTRQQRVKTPIIVGIDQAKTATGIVVCRYHPVGGPRELIHNETVKRMNLKKAWDLSKRVHGLISKKNDTMFALAREEGYFDPRFPDVHGEIERVGGWFEAIFHSLYPDARTERYLARKWRFDAWGHVGSGGYGWTKLSLEARQAHLKGTSLIWARAIFPQIKDHHQADALGILSCHGKRLTARGFIRP